MKETDRYHIYINKHAGTVSDMGYSKLESLIERSDIGIESLHFLGAERLIEKVEQDDGKFPILIGGGDGTIRSCAAHFVNKDKAFGILPLGTMNLLAKDLDIPVRVEDAVSAYAAGSNIYEIDVGKVNDEIFLCCASLGTMPETSEFREKHRGDSTPLLMPRLTAYILKQMDRRYHKRLLLELDQRVQKIKTAALVVSNNQYGPQGQWTEGNFKRPSLQDNILGVYSATPYSFIDKLRLLLNLGLGDWKKDEALHEWECRELRVRGTEKNTLLSLDGETQRFSMPLHFSVLHKGLKMIVPKGK
jgi:diacylglycerol kinase family enzyme